MFLCTSNEQSENEFKNTVPFIIASKRIKCIGINLTKEVKDLCIENFEILFKEIKENIFVYGLEVLMSLRWQYSPYWCADSVQAKSKPQLPF